MYMMYMYMYNMCTAANWCDWLLWLIDWGMFKSCNHSNVVEVVPHAMVGLLTTVHCKVLLSPSCTVGVYGDI